MATRFLARHPTNFVVRKSAGTIRNYAATVASEGKSEFVAKREAVEEHAKGTEKLWKNICIYVCVPALVLSAGNSYRLEQQHKEHKEHKGAHSTSERPPYQYQRIRNKPFPWGDGDKTLFHNPEINH
ncbi:10676_t:CDS:2 [Acaulospora morrowiae]|uniref:Cytochrome c oxidase subunit n=1 Tax=Acaulospora morrowiae TaxID=94023 RepID=A0A9N9A116_9GLOM|nr:10676_t:CDS:2 [Acaulospora morrowiae]